MDRVDFLIVRHLYGADLARAATELWAEHARNQPDLIACAPTVAFQCWLAGFLAHHEHTLSVGEGHAVP